MTDGEPSGSPERHAQTRLDTLTASPEWGARLLAGDAETLAEFHNLSAAALGMTPPPVPSPASTARSQLDAMASDPGFAERFNSGDPAAKQAVAQALEARRDDGGSLMATVSDNVHIEGAGEYTIGTSAVPDRTMQDAIAGFRALGLTDADAFEILNGRELATGRPWPPEVVARTRALRTQRLNDPDWVKRLNARGWQEQRELLLMSGILAHYGG